MKIREAKKVNEVADVVSKRTGEVYSARLLLKSDRGQINDLFLMQQSGHVISRQSIYRNYQSI